MAKKKDVSHKVLDAMLDLAAESGWNRLSLADIAQRANVPLVDLVEEYSGKQQLLGAYSRSLDEAMLHEEGEMPEVSVRDRLFDVVMRRFDAMNRHKEALRVILRDTAGDPYALLCGGRHFMTSTALMLEAAGMSSSGIRGIARLQAMGAIYLYVLNAWLRDDSPDMSRTMAALDKALHRAESLASMLGHRRAPPPAPPTGPMKDREARPQASPPSGAPSDLPASP